MKFLSYKDHAIYLVLITMLVFVGACFTSSVIPYSGIELELKIISIFILLLNSMLIYSLIIDFFKNPTVAFIISVLYLLSPTHLDIFIFQFQLQSLISESLLLSSYLFYSRKRDWLAIGFLFGAVLLNTKLLILLIYIWFFKRITLLQKFMSTGILLVILLFLSPLFFKQSFFLANHFKTIFYTLQNLIYPINVTLLNSPSVVVGYYNAISYVFFIGLFLIGCVFCYRKKTIYLKAIIHILIISIIGSIIPFKQIWETESYHYFYLPSMYPGVLFCMLLLLAVYLDKREFLKKSNLVSVACLGLVWLSANIMAQLNSQNLSNQMGIEVEALPENFNYERDIKLKYSKMLISDNKIEQAELVINKAKMKFPESLWYVMLLEIAISQKDQNKIQTIYRDLDVNQVPLDND